MQPDLRGRLLQVVPRAALLGALALAACQRSAPERVEVPLTPREEALAASLAAEESERWARERDERYVEAFDPGEQAEHTRRLTTDGFAQQGPQLAKALFLQGEAAFERGFTVKEGLGTGTRGPPPGLRKVEEASSGQGPDALACRDCHGRGGDDGHGERHQRAQLAGDGHRLSSASPRVAPHLAGVGLTQLLAHEMSAELRRQRDAVKAAVLAGHAEAPARAYLSSKGVDFGSVSIERDGGVIPDALRGVDADLQVRPFGWKGTQALLSDFARSAFRQHQGLELGPVDGDRDGIAGELHEGQLLSMVAYLMLIDVPVTLSPSSERAAMAWEKGARAFDAVGCAGCHRPSLRLESFAWHQPLADGGTGFTVDVLADSQVLPSLDTLSYLQKGFDVPLFSDLERHDLGPGLAEREEAGVPPSVFLTRPLWGLGDRGAGYLHDGRARTLGDAIRAHGGEASAAREKYEALPELDRRAVDVFLLSLRRMPQVRFSP